MSLKNETQKFRFKDNSLILVENSFRTNENRLRSNQNINSLYQPRISSNMVSLALALAKLLIDSVTIHKV